MQFSQQLLAHCTLRVTQANRHHLHSTNHIEAC
jgi:hypothetical protein